MQIQLTDEWTQTFRSYAVIENKNNFKSKHTDQENYFLDSLKWIEKKEENPRCKKHCTWKLHHTWPKTKAHTGSNRNETAWNNKKF